MCGACVHRPHLLRRRRAGIAGIGVRQRAERERSLSPEIVAQVATLRERAQSVRTIANYADDYSVYRQELAQAECLEHEAEALLAG